MYTPPYNAMDDRELEPLVAAVGSAELITVGVDGFPLATRLPVIWQGQRLVFHMAIANPHWRAIAPDSPALAVVTGLEAYITPRWYAGKAEHGRVVPTWNYSAIHFTGRVTVHRDAEWLERAVTELSDLHEQRRPQPWAVSDAPSAYIQSQLRGIVGIEFAIDKVEGKAKRSQNRSDIDRATIIDGLGGEGGREALMADDMRRDLEG